MGASAGERRDRLRGRGEGEAEEKEWQVSSWQMEGPAVTLPLMGG